MTDRNPGVSSVPKEAKLPLYDWILLPLLFILTIWILSVATNQIAQRAFPVSSTVAENCMVFNDAATGAHGIPNSVCMEKIAESQLTEYRFNSCGHRASMECGTKPADTYRIVMTGSSFATGMRVPIEKTFAGLLPGELSQKTGRKVDLYNEGIPWRTPHVLSMHFDDIVAQKPDMFLWALNPGDLENVSVILPDLQSHDVVKAETAAPVKRASLLTRITNQVKAIWAKKSIDDAVAENRQRLIHALEGSKTGFLLHHILYGSQSLYMKSYLMRGDDDTGYLKSQTSKEWQTRLQQFDLYAASIAAQAKAANVPFVVTLLPKRAQASMISLGTWPAGYDPYLLDNELRKSIESHGGTYISVMHDFRTIPNPERFYFPVDGHPNAEGSAVIAQLLAKELTNGAIPALSTARQTRAVLEGVR